MKAPLFQRLMVRSHAFMIHCTHYYVLLPARPCLGTLAAACSLSVSTSATSLHLCWGVEGAAGHISTGQGAPLRFLWITRTREGACSLHGNLCCGIFPVRLRSLYTNTLPAGKPHAAPSHWQELPSWVDATSQPVFSSENTKSRSKWPVVISLDQGEHMSSHGGCLDHCWTLEKSSRLQGVSFPRSPYQKPTLKVKPPV